MGRVSVLLRCLVYAWVVPSSSQANSIGAYTEQDMCFGKYFKAVSKFGKLVLTTVFNSLYKTLDSAGGTMNLKDFCLQKLKWSNAAFKEKFNQSERDVLSSSSQLNESEVDVSLAFKVILHLLENNVEPLKKDMRELKNLRNRICHQDLTMDQRDLEQHFEELAQVCRRVLEGVQLLTGQDFTQEVHDIECELQDLLVAKLETWDIVSYLEDIKKFHLEKHSKMITEGRKELVRMYSKQKILNPCSWLNDSQFSEFSVDKIFTPVNLIEGNTLIKVSDILKVVDLKTRYDARMIILNGVMGIGKTSLFRYILDEWCKRSPTITDLCDVDIVVGVEMRHVSSRSLGQYLREQLLPHTCRLFSDSDIIPLLQDMNVLFIIDGMDEATRHGKHLLKEIIHKFTNALIIVTTRPEHSVEVMHMMDDHIVLQIEGFNEQNQLVFIKKFFEAAFDDKKVQDDEYSGFVKQLTSVWRPLVSTMVAPITLALLLVLWCNESSTTSSISTITRLYRKIFDINQQKLVSRLEAMGAGHSLALARKVQRWFLDLGKVAWTMKDEDNLCINKEQCNYLMDACEREELDSIQTLSAFLRCNVQDDLSGPQYCFSFHHMSGLEFVAAVHLADEASNGRPLLPMFDELNCSNYKDVIIYAISLLSLNGKLNTTIASQLKSILASVVPAEDYSSWWCLLREAEQHPALCQIIGSIVNQAYTWTINSWEPQDTVEAKMSLLKATGAAPAMLNMTIEYTSSIAERSDLQRILNAVITAEKTVTKLYFDKEFNENGSQELNDVYGTQLLKLNKLQEYKGHVSSDFTKALVNATNTQSLFIRISSVEALVNLSESMQKHRRLKAKFMPSRRWTLKYVEIFLDLKAYSLVKNIPRLRFHRSLVLKLADVGDDSAWWAGDVVRRLNTRYSSVILQGCRLTLKGAEVFLARVKPVKIKTLRIMADETLPREALMQLADKYNVVIGLYNNK